MPTGADQALRSNRIDFDHLATAVESARFTHVVGALLFAAVGAFLVGTRLQGMVRPAFVTSGFGDF
jgi:hypothetical protein